MSRKMMCIARSVLVLCLIGHATVVSAVELVWIGGHEGNAWNVAANWDPAQVPTADDSVVIVTQPGLGPVIDESHVEANAAMCASVDGGDNSMDMTGGSLIIGDDWGIGNKGSAVVNVSGGTVDIGDDLNIGPKGGESTFNMTGGVITASGSLIVARKGGAIATLNMAGGTINCDDVQIAPQDDDTVGVLNLRYGTINTDAIEIATEGGSGLLDVRAGTLIISGDAKATVEGYINNGWITAYDGYGTLQLDYDVTNPGSTTLEATHMLQPDPADGSTVSAGTTQLQWTLPEPNLPEGIVTCDVYFGTNPDVEANPKVVVGQALESVSVTLDPQTDYYWAFDLYDSSVSTTDPSYLSPVFIFNTMNTAPVVDAGDDVATWLDNGLKVIRLDGVVSDEDGGPGPATLLWTVIAEPDGLDPAQISDPRAADATVTLKEVGSYTLQLEVSDGEYTTTDTMEIVLYRDACEHAENQEGFEWIPGDINHDCIVDDLDLTTLQDHWLESNFSTE